MLAGGCSPSLIQQIASRHEYRLLASKMPAQHRRGEPLPSPSPPATAFSWTPFLVGAGASSIIGAIALYSAGGYQRWAQQVGALSVTSTAALAMRADAGGDIGLTAIRGQVVPADPATVLVDVQADAPVVYASTQYNQRSHAVEAGKLVEKTRYLKSDQQSVPFYVADGSGAVAVLDASLGTPPLRDLPTVFTHVQDEGSYELVLTPRNLRLADSRERERAFGIEKTASVLTAGTLLTVVGKATLDKHGVLRMAAGVGPYAISTETLSSIVDGFASSASTTRNMGIFFLVLSAGLLAGAAAYSAWSSDKEATSATDDPI